MLDSPEDGDPFGRFGGNPEETQNEKPETPGPTPGANHSGTDENNGDAVDVVEADALVNIDVVIKRFREQTGKSLRETTKADYQAAFRRFAKAESIDRQAKARLAGPKGRELILHYMNNKVGVRSWEVVEYKLKSVWTYGLPLPWPLTKRDRPEAPPPIRTWTPPDHIVKAWKEAFDREDAYSRVEFKMYGHLGLRPSHLRNILWEDVKNANGETCWGLNPIDTPFMIEADGYERGFKRHAWVRAVLPMDMAEDISALRKELGDKWRPEWPLLGFRDARGNSAPEKQQTQWAQTNRWEKAIKKWRLPKVPPRSFRKFVRSKTVSMGMDETARCYLQGHKPRGMDGVYDNPEMRDLADRQMSRLPNGALGALRDPSVKVSTIVTKDDIDLLEKWKSGKIGDFAFFEALTKLRPPQGDVERPG